jgi:hypothetical protein
MYQNILIISINFLITGRELESLVARREYSGVHRLRKVQVGGEREQGSLFMEPRQIHHLKSYNHIIIILIYYSNIIFFKYIIILHIYTHIYHIYYSYIIITL